MDEQLFKDLQGLGLRKDVTTTGFQIGTGFNFYNLEATAKQLVPVYHPLLDSMPRTPSKGGDSVHWKALTGYDTINGAGYPGASEGNRVAVMDVSQRDLFTKYKFLGKESNVTFQSQLAARNFQDNVAVSNIIRLRAHLMQEEKMLLWGNSGVGPGQNGFQLGTATQPTLTAQAGAGFANGATVAVAVVALTGYGLQASSVSRGIATSFTRTNADGSQDTIFGGSSAISTISAPTTIAGGNGKVLATTQAIRGAIGYAWYVSTSGSPTLANAYLTAITTVPTATLTSAGPNTNQAGNYAGLGTDNSANPLDMDGLLTYCFGQGGYWSDLGGAGLTANGDGTILEIENMLAYFWNNFKTAPTTAWCGGTTRKVISRAILGSGGAGQSQRIVFNADNLGNLKGGTIAASYLNSYVQGTSLPQEIVFRTHPNLPDGVIYFDMDTSPYPDANIGNVREIETMQDYFSIQWPLRSLKYEMGTYSFEALKHYMPFATGCLTGVGHFVNTPSGQTIAA